MTLINVEVHIKGVISRPFLGSIASNVISMAVDKIVSNIHFEFLSVG